MDRSWLYRFPNGRNSLLLSPSGKRELDLLTVLLVVILASFVTNILCLDFLIVFVLS